MRTPSEPHAQLREAFEILFWVAEAGSLAESQLAGLVEEDLLFWRFSEPDHRPSRAQLRARLRYRLEGLVEAELLVSCLSASGEPAYAMGRLLPGVMLDLSVAPEPWAAPDPTSCEHEAESPSYSEWRLGVALAELDGRLSALDSSRPGRRLLDRLLRQYRMRFGPLPRAIAHRMLMPAIGEEVDPEVWKIVLDALTTRPQSLRLWVKGLRLPARDRETRNQLTIYPRRLLYLRGRPHLEGSTQGRVHLIRMARILTAVPLGDMSRPGGHEEFDRLLDRTWGSDAYGRPDQARPELERVILRFHGDACAAIQDEPAVVDARLTAVNPPGQPKVIEYEIETVIGPRFMRWLRELGSDVEVLAPAKLRDALLREARARQHAR